MSRFLFSPIQGLVLLQLGTPNLSSNHACCGARYFTSTMPGGSKMPPRASTSAYLSSDSPSSQRVIPIGKTGKSWYWKGWVYESPIVLSTVWKWVGLSVWPWHGVLGWVVANPRAPAGVSVLLPVQGFSCINDASTVTVSLNPKTRSKSSMGTSSYKFKPISQKNWEKNKKNTHLQLLGSHFHLLRVDSWINHLEHRENHHSLHGCIRPWGSNHPGTTTQLTMLGDIDEDRMLVPQNPQLFAECKQVMSILGVWVVANWNGPHPRKPRSINPEVSNTVKSCKYLVVPPWSFLVSLELNQTLI